MTHLGEVTGKSLRKMQPVTATSPGGTLNTRCVIPHRDHAVKRGF